LAFNWGRKVNQGRGKNFLKKPGEGAWEGGIGRNLLISKAGFKKLRL